MKIFICSSKHFYPHVAPIKEALEKADHVITLPNSYDNPTKEFEMKDSGQEVHSVWKGEMLKLQSMKVAANDAILVLNMEKNGQQNYIGGATFLEIFKAFELGKKIFLYNPIPENILKDELCGMNPTVINGNLELIL
ncbi:MAG: hypothetical protein MUD00_01185 [Candidatus Pacebacteria bacterium]|jgi:hypothetical protein|nr:hypothetical protein [Candidatus Paceibacterota bacterium]